MLTKTPGEADEIPEQAHNSTVGPNNDKPIHADRDVNIATNQVINNAPPSENEIRYAWLVALARYYGANVPMHSTGIDDAPFVDALRPLGLTDPHSLLRDVRQTLLKGLCGDPADGMANGWPDTTLPPIKIQPHAAHMHVALLLLPFVDLYSLDRNGLWVSGLSALSSSDFSRMVFNIWQRYEQSKTLATLQLLAFELAEKVGQPVYRGAVACLLGYLVDRWELLLVEQQIMLSTRRYLPRPRPKEGAQLLRYFAVASGASFGSIIATAAVGDLVVHGQEALLAQIWQRLTGLDSVQAPPVKQHDPAVQPVHVASRVSRLN